MLDAKLSIKKAARMKSAKPTVAGSLRPVGVLLLLFGLTLGIVLTNSYVQESRHRIL